LEGDFSVSPVRKRLSRSVQIKETGSSFPVKINDCPRSLGARVRTPSQFVPQPVDDGVFTLNIGIPGVADRGIVHRRSDAKIFGSRQILLPFDFNDLVVEILGIFGLKILEEKKNPLSCPDMQIEAQGICKRSLGFDSRNGFGEDRKPERQNFLP
jgi:hypothetical protein